MSDSYIFSNDPRSGAPTYEALQARRKIAIALAARQRAFPKNIGEGLTYLGDAIGDVMTDRRLTADEARYRQESDAQVQRVLQPGVAAPPAAPSAAPGPVSAAPDPDTMSLAANDVEKAVQPVSAPPPPPKADLVPPWIRAAVPNEKPMAVEELLPRLARNETGGQRDPYRVVGQRSLRGDRPYGKYQVMGENVPKWTKGYLGRELTPQQFLDDPEAQEQVARAKAGEYLAKYGPTGAAAAWFAGENGMQDPKRKDTLGTHVAEYVRRFNIPLVSREQVVASAARAPGGVPPSGDEMLPPEATPASAPARQDIVNKLAGPQPPVQPPAAPPIVPQQQVAQQQLPISRPSGPPPAPQATPMSPREMEIRRLMGSTADPRIQGQLAPVVQQLEEQRKFEDARKIKQWENDLATYKSEQDPLRRAQLDELRQKIITPSPPAQPQVGPDPRLGTPESPQRTRIPVLPPVPPGSTPQKWSEEQTPQMAKALEAVDRSTPMFDDALKVIQLAKTHPGRDWGIGMPGDFAQKMPWTDAAGFGRVVEQLKGKNFLAGYQLLKGAGPVSEIEGLKTEAAQARVSTAQNKKDFDAALGDLEKQIRRDLELAQRKVNAPVTAWRQAGDNKSYAPDIGQIGTLGGKRVKYIGGDPAIDESYQVLE